MKVIQQKATLRRETEAWQKAALGLIGLSVLMNYALAIRIAELDSQRKVDTARYQEQIEAAEHVRDLAVQELGAMSIRLAEEQQAREAQEAAYDAIKGYTYIGECTITAYCPCEACCGQWADGLTSTGIPAVPGIVAVDPEVIPLGSVVVIGGQRYLAADTGVTGLHVDICAKEHQEAQNFGVQTMAVWVEAEEQYRG